MVTQMVHLKTLSSLGQRTKEPHVMQFPVENSLLAAPLPLCIPVEGALPFCPTIPLPRPGESESVSDSKSATAGALFFGAFFLEENSDGKGWLLERPWLAGLFDVAAGRASESEVFDSAWNCEVSKRSTVFKLDEFMILLIATGLGPGVTFRRADSVSGTVCGGGGGGRDGGVWSKEFARLVGS